MSRAAASCFRALNAAILGVCCFGAAGVARGQIATHDRISKYDITFSNPTFSDASSHYDVIFDATPTNPGDTRDFSPSLKLNWTNLSTSNVGGVEWVLGSTAPDHFNASLSSPTGTPGTLTYGYDSAAVPDFQNVGTFGNSWLEVKNIGGKYALRFGGPFGFRGGGAGIIESGTFDLDIAISGDWSPAGTGAGEHELLNINPTWTIDKNFVYDSGSDKTYFHAFIDSYTSAADAPLLDFVLHSGVAVVPEPSSIVLLAILGGVVGTRVVAIRRRAKSALAHATSALC